MPAQAPAAVAAFDEAVTGQPPQAAQHGVEVHARLDRDGRGAGTAAGGQRVEHPGAVGIKVVAGRGGIRVGAREISRLLGTAGRQRIRDAEGREQLDDIGGAGNAAGTPFPDDPVAPGGLRRSHRPGHGHQRLAQVGGMPCGVQGSAALARLHDHGAAAERGDDPVADEEPDPARMAARRPFADHQALGGDRGEEVCVSRRVRIVDPARQHRDRDRLRGQRAAMRGGVDPVCTARDDRPAPFAKVGGDLAGHVAAVAGGSPRPHHRHRTRAGKAQVRVPA